ncbi:MAG: restriction endonuclease subunit S [Sulfuriferula sp.]|nr:restriction endonuclease subunit S [Sulfuriferula sp.]
MEGLEISEVNYTEAITNKDFRTDSDFWTKASKPNSKLKYVLIGEILLNSQYGISIEMNALNKGYPIYRMNEIHNMVCDFEVDKCADISDDEFKIFELNDRDVLFNRTNSYEWVGRTGVFKKQAGKDFVFASYLVRFIPNQEKVLPEYLASFLSSKFGVNEIRRRARQSINQTNVNPEEAKAIRIPLLNFEIQNSIKNRFDIAVEKLLQSQATYAKAEKLLLDTLGMADFSPETETVSIKSFKDSFAATGRLDAEYYQPKYEQVMAHITAQSHDTLSALVTIKKSIEPGSDEYSDDEQGLPFMRVADYSKFGVTPPQKKIKASFVAENKAKLDGLMPKAGTILFSKDGSVGEAYCLRKDANFITSGAVLHLTVRDTKKLLPDYLTLALNSKLVKMQAEGDAGGSIILHWRVSEIERVVVPLADLPTQQKIATLVQQSFTLKAESERLLAVAKRAVEIAIEQDEAIALSWLSSQVPNAGALHE